MIGQHVTVYGIDCIVFKVHPFGTIDVVAVDGSRAYRLSGLPLDIPAQQPQKEGQS